MSNGCSPSSRNQSRSACAQSEIGLRCNPPSLRDRPMRNLLQAGKLLLLDLASAILFVVVYLVTHNIPLAICLGIALGVAQIGVQFARRKPIDTMEWLSLFLVVAPGTAALLTNDPRFVMFKPSVIYAIVGIVMLKPGWINRYLPPLAKAVVP